MKLFTSSDIMFPGTATPCIYTDIEDLVECPLDWQKLGLQQTASGYGRKLTTSRKINFNKKFYRIYCTQFSNAGSHWFTVKGVRIYIH